MAPAKKKLKKPVKRAAKPAPKTAKAKPAAKAKAKAPPKKPPPKKPPPKPAGILPTPQEEARFWSLIEDAWSTQPPEINAARAALATRDPDGDDDGDDVQAALDAVVDNLRAALANEDFPQAELVAMDRVLERKLYDIDRADIQAVTDGSDDGFLYARGFIVALGKAFYAAVRENPDVAIMDAEQESMCYLPARVHEERFGDYPETGSGISRESASNSEGWADAD